MHNHLPPPYASLLIPSGASRSESSISTYGQTVSQPIFETSRDVIARTYLHTPVSSPQKHGLQPMCETNDSPGSLQYLSPASQALRARLQGEIDASFSPSHVQLPAQDFSLKPASADLPAQSQQRTGQTFQTTPSHRNHKRFNQEMEDDDDSTTDVDDDTSAMQCDRSRPTRALPRSKPLTQTRSLPLFDMQADF